MEIAYLLGVGLEVDSRDVVADDLDGDGKMDLLLTHGSELASHAAPRPGPSRT